MSESKIELIARLLAKAESTTPHEAEALTQHAERLMVKYAIDQAVIDARRAKEGKSHEAIIEVKVPFEGTYRDALMEMGNCAILALGQMRTLQSRVGNRTLLWIIGFEGDVKQAETLVRSLHVQALLAQKQWWRENAPAYRFGSDWDRRKARQDFIIGFGYGVYGRISENRLTTIEEAGNGTELVLLDRKALVDQFVDDMDIRKAREGNRKTDGRAANAGAQAGRKARTGEREVGMNSRAISA